MTGSAEAVLVGGRGGGRKETGVGGVGARLPTYASGICSWGALGAGDGRVFVANAF